MTLNVREVEGLVSACTGFDRSAKVNLRRALKMAFNSNEVTFRSAGARRPYPGISNMATLLIAHPQAALDKDGRCCGHRPVRGARCAYCKRRYDAATGLQVPSSEWLQRGAFFRRSEAESCRLLRGYMWFCYRSWDGSVEYYERFVDDTTECFRVHYRRVFVS